MYLEDWGDVFGVRFLSSYGRPDLLGCLGGFSNPCFAFLVIWWYFGEFLSKS